MSKNIARTDDEEIYGLYVEKYSIENGDTYQLSIRCNYTDFEIRIPLDETSSSSELVQLLQKEVELKDSLFLAQLKVESGFPRESNELGKINDEYHEIEDRIWDYVCLAGRDMFRDLSGPPVRLGQVDLQTFVTPPRFRFDFVNVDGKMKFVRQESPEPFNKAAEIFNVLKSDMPRIPASQITVIKTVLGRCVTKVLVDEQERQCRLLLEDNAEVATREWNSLIQISSSKHASSVLPSKVVSLVEAELADGKTGVVGIIETCRSPDLEYKTSTLAKTKLEDVGIARKKKWMGQIQRYITALHDVGRVWGNGEPANIIIDEKTDDAGIFNFGIAWESCWPECWEDENLADSMRRDQEALDRIAEFLGVAEG